MNKKRGLGRGLSALIPVENAELKNEMREVDINLIFPNPQQPRQKIVEESLVELINSIKTHGLIQPIIVRQRDNGNYEIIAGERRWQACKKLKMKQVPVIVKDYDDLEASAAALIENIQREDLNAIDEANAYKKLMDNYGLTQEELSARVGKSRSFIANMVRLLALPDELIEMLTEGIISAGHARALLSLPDTETQIRFALKIIKQHMSVRKTEQLIKNHLEDKVNKNKKADRDPESMEWEKRLSGVLGNPVQIKNNPNGSGKVIIEFTSREELTRLINSIKIN